uniref:SHSP domain-containing protein n=1 Tax=Heterorhabditis bacteriophora TaxID=37862 RepID=A0A1I7XLW6_HETBA
MGRARKREGRKIDSQEVIESLESERRKNVLAKPNYDEIPVHTTNRRVAKLDADGIITLTKKFEPTANPRCSIVHPWGHELRQIFFKGFSKKETLTIIKCINLKRD